MPVIPIDTSQGSNIGDMTGGGGLAAAFDGDADESTNDCAQGTVSGEGWCGKTLASAKRIYSAVVYGSNIRGYTSSALSDAITITLYGKQGAAPSSGTNGTSLGSTSFTDANNANSKTITSNDPATFWDHVWVYIDQTSGTADTTCLAELELNEVSTRGSQAVIFG